MSLKSSLRGPKINLETFRDHFETKQKNFKTFGNRGHMVVWSSRVTKASVWSPHTPVYSDRVTY